MRRIVTPDIRPAPSSVDRFFVVAGLHPIVLGIVKVVGKQFFNTEVRANISVVSEFGDRAHVTLEITEQNKEGKSTLLPRYLDLLFLAESHFPAYLFVLVVRLRGSLTIY